MAFITIDQEKCKHDNICVDVCPYGLLINQEDASPEPVANGENFCIACGHCVTACPHQALTLLYSAGEDLPVIDKNLKISIEAAEQFLRSRRSIRCYKDKAVSKDILNRIIETTRWAPTAINCQPVQWIVIQDANQVHHLAELAIEAFKAGNMLPEIVKAWDNGKDMILRSAPHLVITHSVKEKRDHTRDCIIALSYLELAAHAHGLGTCWAGMLLTAANNYPPLLEALNLPDGHILTGAMMLGYPKYKYKQLPKRKDTKIEWR